MNRTGSPRVWEEMSATADARVLADRPADERLRQGGMLLAGALVLGDDPRRFHLVPIGLGAIYLASPLAGGRRGAYWATALPLLGWGTAVMFVQRARPDLDTAGLYLVGAGLGCVVGLLLARRGVAVDPLGLAGTVVLGGASLSLYPQVAALTEAVTYALAVGAVGLVNIALALAARR